MSLGNSTDWGPTGFEGLTEVDNNWFFKFYKRSGKIMTFLKIRLAAILDNKNNRFLQIFSLWAILWGSAMQDVPKSCQKKNSSPTWPRFLRHPVLYPICLDSHLNPNQQVPCWTHLAQADLYFLRDGKCWRFAGEVVMSRMASINKTSRDSLFFFKTCTGCRTKQNIPIEISFWKKKKLDEFWMCKTTRQLYFVSCTRLLSPLSNA